MTPANNNAPPTDRALPLTLGTLIAAAACATLAAPALVAAVVRTVLVALVALHALELALTAHHKRTMQPLAAEEKHYALVTGASSGIGRELVFQLAAQGYSLVLAARTKDALDKVRLEIEALHGAHVHVEVCACDLSTLDGIDALVAFVRERELVVDILINNAGASWTSDFADLNAHQVDALLTLNVVAMTKLSHALIPDMVARGEGRVLNVSSMSAAISIPTAALYGSSKAFVLNLSQAMDYELRGTGVSVTCVCPGPVHTNFGNSAHCDGSIYMNTPGLALNVTECATRALAAMFRAETEIYDSFVSRWSATLFRSVLPTRVGLLVAAVSMNEPKRAWAMIK